MCTALLHGIVVSIQVMTIVDGYNEVRYAI